MKVDFRFNHPCGVSLAPGRVCSPDPDRIAVLKVGYKNSWETIGINDVPEEAWGDFNSSEFSAIMIGVKLVAEYIKTTKRYATGKIGHLEDAYNAWQKWCQEDID